MGLGVAFALLAGMLWGLVFLVPLLLPEYPAALLAMARYLAFGLLCLPLAWLDWGALRRLTRADWLAAAKLAAVGNLAYYTLLASSIQGTGGPLTTLIIGTLPVVIAIAANQRNAARDGLLPWRRLLLPLGIMLLGIALVNQAEMTRLLQQPDASLSAYTLGALLALGVLDLVPAAQRRLAAPAPGAQPARLGHGAGPGHVAHGPGRFCAGLGLDVAQRQHLPHAPRAGSAVFPLAHAGAGAVCLVVRHSVLEPGQQAPAHRPSRAADRVRDRGGADLHFLVARRVAAGPDGGWHGAVAAGGVAGAAHPAGAGRAPGSGLGRARQRPDTLRCGCNATASAKAERLFALGV